MPARLRLVLTAAALLLLGCAGSGDSRKDLVTIKEARSLAAEWALVNRLAASGRLRPAYVRTMREEAIGQLETALASLADKEGEGAREIGALAHMPPDTSAGLLYAHARRLQALEDRLEAR
jgi:hypothetical protein